MLSCSETGTAELRRLTSAPCDTPVLYRGDAPPVEATDWACDSYFKAVNADPSYICFVKKDTRMPMIYIDDVVRGTLKFLEADSSSLSQRVYNMNGCSFTPEEQAASIKRVVQNFQQTYAPDFRQAIADSWPESLDDSVAKQDWGWAPEFDLDRMTKEMIDKLKN